jgi:hypothetical protein
MIYNRNMKKSHASYIGVFVALILVGYIFWANLFPTPNLTLPGQQNAPIPQYSETISIEDYVRQNISLLSPQKEQVGGTFYVTSIEAHGGAGTVSYEDGHNAYTADFTYAVDERGNPKVGSFAVRS